MNMSTGTNTSSNIWINYIIYSDKRIWSISSDIDFVVNWKWEIVWFDYENDIETLWEDLSLYDMKLWQYLLCSSNSDYLHSFLPKILENWAEPFWEFEKDGMYYIIVNKPKIEWEIILEVSKKVTDLLT